MSDRALRESFPGGKKETKGEQKDTKDGKGGQGSARADPDVTQDLPRLEQKHDQKEASSSLLGKGQSWNIMSINKAELPLKLCSMI
jgi:hypothetical protein